MRTKMNEYKRRKIINEWLSYILCNLNYLEKHIQLADRISLLAYDTETNDGVSINIESLATFIMFLSSNRIEKKPSICLRTNGFIDGLWRNSKEQVVEIIFRPRKIQSVLITTDPTKKSRIGNFHADTIIDAISNRKLDSLLF